jgi:sugar/nucleoside kinase (ribokinase family)
VSHAPARRSRIVVVGSTARDTVDGGPSRPGGAPVYAGRALAALGADGYIVTRCAPADRPLVELVKAAGVRVAWRPCSATPAFRIEHAAGERVLTLEALADPWSVEDVAAVPAGSCWIHAAPLWRGELPSETLAALAARGRVCLDGQGLVRPARLGRVRLDAHFDRADLSWVSALHLSEVEAQALRLGQDAKSLGSLGVPEVIVTFGERGSLVCHDGRATAVAAEPVAGADPTGAGDAFTAAYLAGRCQGGEPVEAAEAATAVVRELLLRQLQDAPAR